MDGKFADGAADWQHKLGLIRDTVRQQLVSRQLAGHLPSPAQHRRVLDIGCGQGTQAIRLASLGFQVVGIDPSDELLAQAKKESLHLAKNLKFLKGTLEDVPAEAGTDFDVVCCHGVLMYLHALQPAIKRLTELSRKGGLISVLTRNRASIAFRAGMLKDWTGAINGFDATHYKNRLGIESVRADEPEEVIQALTSSGAELLDWYGVRLFTDHWEDQMPPDDFSQLLEAEYLAGQSDPYRQLAALTHVIAKNRL